MAPSDLFFMERETQSGYNRTNIVNVTGNYGQVTKVQEQGIMKRVRNIGMVAVLAIAALAIAQDGFKLRRMPKEGEEITMSLRADVEVMGMNAIFTAKLKDKVTKVEANGDYSVESSQSDGKIKLDGQEDMEAPSGNGPTTTKYSAAGAILSVTGEDTSEEALRMANMSAFAFEDRLFKNGETIVIENKASKLNGNVASKATVIVGATETIKGHECVVMTYDYKETSGEVPATSTGKVWISLKDGAPVMVDSVYKNAPFPGAPGPINAKVKIERL